MIENPDNSEEVFLRKFAKDRNEDAFRALVEKYTDLVHGVALRRTGQADAAEEIAQEVFLILARKAGSITKHGSLGAWLHRVTLLESLKFLRKRANYQRNLAMYRENQNTSHHDSQLWQEIRPLIDQLFDRLSSSDRQILVKHYIEGLPFAEIAPSMGITPAATQKRSVRALEKLSRLLTRRGVSVSAVVLASGLGTELCHAAPMGLASKLSASALVSPTSTSALTSTLTPIMASTKPLTAGALIIATALIPIGLQWQENRGTTVNIRPCGQIA